MDRETRDVLGRSDELNNPLNRHCPQWTAARAPHDRSRRSSCPLSRLFIVATVSARCMRLVAHRAAARTAV